jgi:hypothetical protein
MATPFLASFIFTVSTDLPQSKKPPRALLICQQHQADKKRSRSLKIPFFRRV